MSQSPMRSRVLPWPGDGQWRVWSDAWFVITVGLSLNTSLHAFTAAWVQHAYTVAPIAFAPLASFALSSLEKLSARIDAESSFAADSGRIVGHLNCLAGGRPA